MIDFNVESSLCTVCGDCVADCPSGIIELSEDQNGPPFVQPVNEEKCIRCQHCLAICPTGAISILGKHALESAPIDAMANPDQVDALIRNRRTVRRFRKENTPPQVMERLIRAAANAPTGKNERRVMLTMIDNWQGMERLKDRIISRLEVLGREGKLTGKNEAFIKLAQMFREGQDIIFRGAPHMLMASCPADAATPVADGIIAVSYIELLAYSLGLGTVWAGFVMRILEVYPELKTELGIPEDHIVSYVLLLGNPDRRFHRGVQRDDIVVNRPVVQ